MRHERNVDFYSDRRVVEHYADVDGQLMAPEETLFDAYLRGGMDILDLGVGAGRTTPYLSELAGRYAALDVAEPMIEACRERFPALEFHVADAADLSAFDDGSFDAVVFSFNGIDYLPSAERRRRCLAECHRVLREKGVLIIARHNPRALLAVPSMAGRSAARRLRACASVPLWALRRSVRMVPTRAFWAGQGAIAEPAVGFNGPLLRRRDPDQKPLVTEMATPRKVAKELGDAGFDVVTSTGGVRRGRTWVVATSWYHYVATRA